MSLLNVHRLLIGSGIAAGVLFAILQLQTYLGSADTTALLRAGVAALVAIVLGIYLRSLRTL